MQYMLPVAVARSSSDDKHDNATYASCFHIMGQIQTQAWNDYLPWLAR